MTKAAGFHQEVAFMRLERSSLCVRADNGFRRKLQIQIKEKGKKKSKRLLFHFLWVKQRTASPQHTLSALMVPLLTHRVLQLFKLCAASFALFPFQWESKSHINYWRGELCMTLTTVVYLCRRWSPSCQTRRTRVRFGDFQSKKLPKTYVRGRDVNLFLWKFKIPSG